MNTNEARLRDAIGAVLDDIVSTRDSWHEAKMWAIELIVEAAKRYREDAP